MPETPRKPKHPRGGRAVHLALASLSGLALLAGAPSADRARASGVVEPVADAYVAASHPRARHGGDPTVGPPSAKQPVSEGIAGLSPATTYEIGEWHVIALNSNCSKIGGCGQGSPREQWLRADLAAHPAPCTLA